MGKDKSAQERLAYDREIGEKERAIEDMILEQKKAEKMMDEFDVECERSFQRLQELNEEQIRHGSSWAHLAQQEEDGKRRYLRQMMAEQREETGRTCRKAVQDLEEEREQLQKKRGELPWD